MKKNKKTLSKTKSRLILVVDHERRVFFTVNSFRKRNVILKSIVSHYPTINHYKDVTGSKGTEEIYVISNDTHDPLKTERFLHVYDEYEKIKQKDISFVYGKTIVGKIEEVII